MRRKKSRHHHLLSGEGGFSEQERGPVDRTLWGDFLASLSQPYGELLAAGALVIPIATLDDDVGLRNTACLMA
jgi:hypothetical protein